MANINCSACDDLRQDAPSVIVNGLTATECTSLKNNTGLSPSSGNNDCTDLNNLNDCLVGNMAAEIDAYDVCDWKPFMKEFIPNVWTTLKGVICAVCGLWTKVNCTYRALTKLVNTLASTSSGVSFVRYYRDLGSAETVPYWENVGTQFSATLNIYMNSGGASPGNKVADRDYVVLIQNCTNYIGFREMEGYISYYSSGDTRSIEVIRGHQAQHPDIKLSSGTDSITNYSWTTSGAVLLKKGEYIKVNFHTGNDVSKGNSLIDGAPKVRLHQFVMTWIPINVDEPLDPSDILTC